MIERFFFAEACVVNWLKNTVNNSIAIGDYNSLMGEELIMESK